MSTTTQSGGTAGQIVNLLSKGWEDCFSEKFYHDQPQGAFGKNTSFEVTPLYLIYQLQRLSPKWPGLLWAQSRLESNSYYSRIRIHEGPGISTGSPADASIPVSALILKTATVLPGILAQSSRVPSLVIARF
jgi:hypothetical protein